MYITVIVMGMFSFAVIGIIISAIPYAIWMIFMIAKKGWRACLVHLKTLLVIIGILGALALSLPACDTLDLFLHHSRVFDVWISLDKPSFSYYTERGIQGDGYSFEMYCLPENVRKRFESADKKLLSTYPKRPFSRFNWERAAWKATPAEPDVTQFLELALPSYNDQLISALQAYFNDIRDALSRKGAFYAYFHKRGWNIDLFIVDLENARIYIINHNT